MWIWVKIIEIGKIGFGWIWVCLNGGIAKKNCGNAVKRMDLVTHLVITGDLGGTGHIFTGLGGFGLKILTREDL